MIYYTTMDLDTGYASVMGDYGYHKVGSIVTDSYGNQYRVLRIEGKKLPRETEEVDEI